MIPKSVQPGHIAEFTEQQLLGDGVWSKEQDEAVMGLEGSLADGHKYCWDASGIK